MGLFRSWVFHPAPASSADSRTDPTDRDSPLDPGAPRGSAAGGRDPTAGHSTPDDSEAHSPTGYASSAPAPATDRTTTDGASPLGTEAAMPGWMGAAD